MVVFSPWAFGTTEEWSIWTMNIAAYLLGLVLATKWCVRWRTGYRPARWGDEFAEAETVKRPALGALRLTTILTRTLAVLTGLILAYILVSVLNKRAVYLPGLRRFEYFESISWLPQTYDGASTWQIFWMYLGLACFFWAVRDWLLGKTSRERHRGHGKVTETKGLLAPTMLPVSDELRSDAISRKTSADAKFCLPIRLQRLLWILCINGAVLGAESILQRLSGTNKLSRDLTTRRKRSLGLTHIDQMQPHISTCFGRLVWRFGSCSGKIWTASNGLQDASANAAILFSFRVR